MELALPITVYWDLSSCMPSDGIPLLTICREIIECRPLMLQLYDPSPSVSEAARTILEQFKGTTVAVSLTVPCSVDTGDLHKTYALKELLLSADSLQSLKNMIPNPEAGIAYCVNRDNWRELPDVVSFCRSQRIVRLVLPMQRLYNGEEPFWLNRDEQKILEVSLSAVGGIEGIRLTIHDPFLWRAFNPAIPFPQGGCQAANTMIAISPGLALFPCPTFPVEISRLGADTMKNILTSPVKKELRRKILEYPSACGDCDEVTVCRGGCRGRSYLTHGSLDDIDDACR